MTPIQLFATFNGHEVRWNGDPSNPYWIAQDVCRVLDLSDPSMSCRNIPRHDLVQVELVSGGQNRQLLAVNEAGLYRLIFKSRKPEAQKFQDWVFREGYSLKPYPCRYLVLVPIPIIVIGCYCAAPTP